MSHDQEMPQRLRTFGRDDALNALADDKKRLTFDERMAIEDAQTAMMRAAEVIERTERNRDMWKAQCERQAAELEALRRGEFICKRCGLRKDADASGPAPF